MQTQPQDKINTETRIIGTFVILVLLLAFLALYVFPEYTDIDFAWTIMPPTTAILIGAGYTGGAYFFLRVITEKKWHRVQAGFPAITAFTICMLLATLLHWDRFHQGTFLFFLWTAIYVLTPVVVPLLWFRNRPQDPRTLDEQDLVFSATARWALRLLGIAGAAICAWVFIQPSVLMAVSPWVLTQLTARVFAGWSLLTFLTVFAIAVDGRWSATRILLQSAIVAQVLTILALPRMWKDLDQSRPMTNAFVYGVIAALLAFIALHVWLDILSRRGRLNSTK